MMESRNLACAVLLAVAHATASAAHPDAEAFGPFLDRFIADAAFRYARIEMPLQVLVGSPSEDPTAASWPEATVRERFTVPLSTEQLEARGLKQKLRKLNAKEREVHQAQPESDSYLLTYRFKLRDGQWVLTYFEDSSY